MKPEFWRGKRVLVTGHTGFKGGWLSLWLRSMGAEVHGLALAPVTEPNLFTVGNVGEGLASSTLGDICDYSTVLTAVKTARPEIIFHLAAQPLVRYSYKHPVTTYATNVMGVVHLLEAVRVNGGVRVVINVTTDKCYENREWPWGYRENEAMGGSDPYSSSKGCAELVTRAYRDSFLEEAGVSIATARAGNVIGGGDWAADRLVPDVFRAFEEGKKVQIRNPRSIRPWQHVLEPLSGYLLLAEQLWKGGTSYADAWNFGPDDADARPVEWIVRRLADIWGKGAAWDMDGDHHPHEAGSLKLDISKARSQLGWHPHWDLSEALDRAIDWHRAWLSGAEMRALCLQQIAAFTGTSTQDS